MRSSSVFTASHASRSHAFSAPAIDAVILLGASCRGPEEYALVAAELGYGPLAMPAECDVESIRAQLEQLALPTSGEPEHRAYRH